MEPVTKSEPEAPSEPTRVAYASGGQDVIGVEEREVVALDVAGALVAGGAEAVVGGVDHADPRVAGGPLLGDVAGPVGRAVVDHDRLPGAVGLRHEALQARRQPLLDAVGGHHDADQRVTSPQQPHGPNLAPPRRATTGWHPA